MHAMERITGAFSAVVLSEDTLLAFRDPDGIRPLVLGDLDGSPVVASETPALDIIGATAVRELEPGELLICDSQGSRVIQAVPARRRETMCVFEHIYFARPDAKMDGQTLYEERERMGEQLAAEAPVEADVVIPVPDSGTPAAQGYARASGLPFADGLIKNRYVGRTFIQPDQALRDHGVRLKFNPLPHVIEGQRLIVVDDSIVRGSTTRKLVEMLRAAGAREVHLRISAPPIISPCYYGVDMAAKDELIAAGRTVDEICEQLGADSLAYLSLEGLQVAIERPADRFCRACLTGNYPVAGARGQGQAALRRRARARMSAREPLTYAEAGVSLQAADAVVDASAPGRRVDAHAARARRSRRLRRPRLGRRLPRPGARRGHRRRRHEADAAARGRAAARLRHRSRRDVRQRRAHVRRRARALPRLHRRRPARSRARRRPRRGRGRRLPAGRLRAARRRDGRAPDMYGSDDLDLAGFALGIVERDGIVDARASPPGDAVIGLASSGVHSNGFTLVRRLLERAGAGPADAPGDLLAPTRIYAGRPAALRAACDVRAMAHITGGGLPGNLPRALPEGLGARSTRRLWQAPAVLPWLAGLGVERDEMRRVFNGGLGYVAIVPAGEVAPALAACAGAGCEAWLVGEVVARHGRRVPGALARARRRARLGLRLEPGGADRAGARALGDDRRRVLEQRRGVRARARARRRHRERRVRARRARGRQRAAATPRWPNGWRSATSSWSSAPGFMGVLTSGFLERFPARVLNLHPSLLPAFPGAHAIEDAYAARRRGDGRDGASRRRGARRRARRRPDPRARQLR